jgi:hypothetical protein
VKLRLAGETEVLGEKTCLRATLSTTNPTLLKPGLNPDRRGGKPATNSFFNLCGGTLGTAATTGLLYQAQMIGDCGEIVEMKTVRGNRSTRRKPAPAPLCPLQIPHD